MKELLNHINVHVTSDETQSKTFVECRDKAAFDRMLSVLSQELGLDSIRQDTSNLQLIINSESETHYALTLGVIGISKTILEMSEPERLGKWDGIHE